MIKAKERLGERVKNRVSDRVNDEVIKWFMDVVDVAGVADFWEVIRSRVEK